MTATPEDEEANEAVADAGALDFLLADGALGVLRRFRPDGSLLRLAAGLARRPRLVGGQAATLATELGMITAGRSAQAPSKKDRRFADPAWTSNPLLKRTVQAYLAAGQSAQALLDGAELDWRDDTRLRFVLTNLIAATAPSNSPLLNPGHWKAGSRQPRCQRAARPPGAGVRPGREAAGALDGAARRVRGGQGPGEKVFLTVYAPSRLAIIFQFMI